MSPSASRVAASTSAFDFPPPVAAFAAFAAAALPAFALSAAAAAAATSSVSPMLFVNSLNPPAMSLTREIFRRSPPPYTKLRSAARIRGESSASIRRATYGKHSSTMAVPNARRIKTKYGGSCSGYSFAISSSLSDSSPTRDALCALSASVFFVMPPPLPYNVSRVSASTGTTIARFTGSFASSLGTNPRFTRSPRVLS
eukprot:31151-Pelagococcus_subviridis.AAC.5